MSDVVVTRLRVVASLLTFVVLASCGFQIRGETSVPPEMTRTYVSTNDRHSLFYRKLRLELLAAGVELVNSPAEATAIFNILSDITDQRVLSVSARNVPREYEVYYTIEFSVTSGQQTMLERRTQTQTRAYNWDETQVLGKSQEEQQLRNALVDDLVRIVLIQLAAI